MRFLVAVAIILAAGRDANAQQDAPFPEFNTKGYCTELVSKMLVQTEKDIEYQKCLVSEDKLKEAARKYWYLVPPKLKTYVLSHYFNEVKFETYTTIAQYVATSIGYACMTSKLDCNPPKNQ